MILDLTLKRQWFDMIKSGEKKEEYREIKPYWVKRFLINEGADDLNQFEVDEMITDMQNPLYRHSSVEELMQYFEVRFKSFKGIFFQNGYGKKAPWFSIENKQLTIAQGREEWGAIPGKYYFVFRLGELVSTN